MLVQNISLRKDFFREPLHNACALKEEREHDNHSARGISTGPRGCQAREVSFAD